MSMFNRFLASAMYEGSQIDTLLERGRYAPGEQMRGIVKLRGGPLSRRIEGIHLILQTDYAEPHLPQGISRACTLMRYPVCSYVCAGPLETKELPFCIQLPAHLPLTIGETSVWLQTVMENGEAREPSDEDRIEVIPSVEQSIVIDAVNRLGFRLRSIHCLPWDGSGFPSFMQPFEFVAASSFQDLISGLRLVFWRGEEGMELYVYTETAWEEMRLKPLAGPIEADHRIKHYNLSDMEWRLLGAEELAEELAEWIRTQYRYVT
ncbi:SpoOM family protein [Paenibacillus dendritiformis]|uniref:sporulation protein n=1 Tax=Paenibacillus dendritiformis TaxID=130049 RepID=UPI0018CFAC4F|nr:sporulation protein [Paenibacillus dendritiformis]MBG9792494.1 SpoOM family protein [Paenibacillus dendritiformis]